MYREEIYKLIQTAPNFAVVKTYYFLANLKQFEGGVFTTNKYVAECIKLSDAAVNQSVAWLIKNNYLTETKFNGQKQYILNKLIKSEEKVEKNIPNKKKDGSHRQYLPE